ncbi:MAG: hydantoinase/oxoprolinase family protein, partial [Halobacteriaceae archaeon]
RQSVAICLLFSFENPEHEEQIETIIEEMADDITYSLSSNILPEIREYERTLTTALNAALKPILQGYIRQLTDEIASKDIDPQLHIMQSNGGIITANVAAEKPVQTILSGPAAGVKGATFIGQNTGHDDLITMDMGGTSCDVSLVTGGEPTITTEGTIGDYSITVPMVDIHTVGAGGGSIAWIDKGEALRVGPQSAGAQPGPICYGRGGEEPTITDAHLLLGRLDPSRFVGGDFDVNRDRVAEIFKENLATPLDRSVEGAAQGVLDVANANMERALRVVSVEQGYDPREFTLVPFGGAGPLHGPKLAKQLDIPEVLIPRTAGVLSALGLLISDVIRDYSSTRVRPWDEVTVDVIKPLITDLHEQGESYLEDIGIRSTNQSYEYYLDVRYAGQSHDISVPISEAITPETLEEVQTRFHSRHEQRYGHADRSEDIELVTIRVRARGEVTPPSLPSLDRSASREDAIIEQRTVVFEGEDYHTTVYDRPTIPPECSFAGPAIIEGTESTTVVYPDQTVSVDEYGNLRITHSS